jgi:aspartyl-tRNA(Asn)/glutamyl-tRNA(Gln) amidotransferase subunit C
MSISKQDVLTVARLARLALSEEGAQEMTAELSKILDYVDQLSEVDTSGVPRTAHVLVDRAPLRDDVVLPGVDKARALQQAPRSDAIGFLVPGFVDES